MPSPRGQALRLLRAAQQHVDAITNGSDVNICGPATQNYLDAVKGAGKMNRISDEELAMVAEEFTRAGAGRTASALHELRDARRLLTAIRETFERYALADKAKAATEGPWHVGLGRGSEPNTLDVLDKNQHTEIATCWPEQQRENAELIAGAVNAVRDVLTILSK